MTDAERHAPDAADPGRTEAAPAASVSPLASVIAGPPRTAGRGGSLLFILAGAIAIGGLAFAAGRLTAPAAATIGLRGSGQLPGGQLPGGQLPGDGTGFPGRGAGGVVTVSGTVTAVTAEAITVELASGTSVTIPVDGTTAYRAAAPATAAAVVVGSEVAITPGARTIEPGSSFDPASSSGPGGPAFGTASSVTVIEP